MQFATEKIRKNTQHVLLFSEPAIFIYQRQEKTLNKDVTFNSAVRKQLVCSNTLRVSNYYSQEMSLKPLISKIN